MEREILYEIAYFIMNNPGRLIVFLNSQGYDVPMNATTQELNDIVSDGIFDKRFATALIKFMAENNEYRNFIVAVAAAVSALGQAVANVVISAKQALFGRQMALKAEQRQKELTEWQKMQAEIAAKKSMSLELSRMQSEMVLQRDMEEKKEKSKKEMMMFGMFAVGAIVLAVIAKKLTD